MNNMLKKSKILVLDNNLCNKKRIVYAFRTVFRTLKYLKKFCGLKYSLDELKKIINNDKKKGQFINTRNLLIRGIELQ